jgi:hypothetical protein
MSDLSDILDDENTKIIYVYDFNMWTFLVELAAIEEQEAGNLYPETLFSHGEMPDEAMEKSFEADNADDYTNDYEDGLDEDDLDLCLEGDDSFEDFGFKEELGGIYKILRIKEPRLMTFLSSVVICLLSKKIK